MCLPLHPALSEEMRGFEFSTDDRELGRPELPPLGKCRGYETATIGYGHMNMFELKIEISHVVSASSAGPRIPPRP